MQDALILREAHQALRAIYPQREVDATKASYSLLERFSLLVLSGEVASDEEAVKALYGADKPANYPAYQKLKYKFKRYFPLACTTLPDEDVSPLIRQSTSFCKILYAHAQRCLQAGLFSAAERILNRAWKTAHEHQSIVAIYLLSESYLQLYAIHLPNTEKFTYFKSIYEQYSALYVIERICATNRYALDTLAMTRNRRLTNHIAYAEELAAETAALADGLNFSSLLYNNYSTQITAALLGGHHAKARDLCDKALSELIKCSVYAETVKEAFIDVKSRILAKMGDYSAFMVNYKITPIEKPSFHRRVIRRSHEAIICLGTDHFDQAAEALQDIQIKEIEQHFSPENGDMMKVIFAYVHLLNRMGYVQDAAMPAQVKQFNMTKFFNDCPAYERNKQGYNIHLIVLQLFTYLLDQRFNLFFDKAEGMEKYRLRYLNNEDGKRNGLLIQMLLSAQLHNFEAQSTRAANIDRLKELKQTNNLAVELDVFFYEFIPYERLWELYLEILD